MGETLDMGNSETSRIFTKNPMYSYKTLLKKFHMHINDTCHAFVKNLVNLVRSIILSSIPIGSICNLSKKAYVWANPNQVLAKGTIGVSTNLVSRWMKSTVSGIFEDLKFKISEG